MVDYNLQVGTTPIRAEVIDSLVKQTAARMYKFKQACAIVPTSAWKNTFFREDLSTSSGPTGNLFKGLPRGASFPQRDTPWETVSVRIVKFGSEVNIPWEDILSNDINVMARSIIRRTEDVVKAVDDHLWDSLTGTTLSELNLRIQSYAISGTVSGHGYWDESSAAITDDLMSASRLIAVNGNYDVNDLICFVSPRDKQSMMKWLADKGAQWNALAQDITVNGGIGRLAGITLIESVSVPASYALVVKPKTCATINELVSLRSNTTDDPFKSVRVRVVEELSVSVTDPLAICVIQGTQSVNA